MTVKHDLEWGVGLEHEFIVTTDGADGEVSHIWDSEWLVERAKHILAAAAAASATDKKGGVGNKPGTRTSQRRRKVAAPSDDPDHPNHPNHQDDPESVVSFVSLHVIRANDHAVASSSKTDDEARKMLFVDNLILETVSRDPLVFALPFVLPLPVSPSSQDIAKLENVRVQWRDEILSVIVASGSTLNLERILSFVFATSVNTFGKDGLKEFRTMLKSILRRKNYYNGKKNGTVHMIDHLRATALAIASRYLSDTKLREGDVLMCTPTKRIYALLYTPSPVHFYERTIGGNSSGNSRLSLPDLIQNLTSSYVKGLLKIGTMVKKASDAHKRIEKATSVMKTMSVDWYFVEVRSTKYLRKSMKDVIRQVQAGERSVLRAVAGSDEGTARIYPFGGLSKMSETTMSGASSSSSIIPLPNYTGSYHSWITLPYSRTLFLASLDERARLSRCHAILAHRLQWIEPLLMAIMTGDPRAVGNGHSYPRASMRSTMNELSGYGTTDPSKLLHVAIDEVSSARRDILLPSIVSNFFESVDDVHTAYTTTLDQRASLEVPITELLRPRHRSGVHLWVKTNGDEWSKHRTCVDVDRFHYARTEEGAGTFDTRLKLGIEKDWTPYQELLTQKKVKYMIHAANDIRVEGCGRVLSFPILRGWEPVWVRIPPPFEEPAAEKRGDVHLAVHFVSVKKNKNKSTTAVVTAEAPVDTDMLKKNKAVGFEFRVMDNCPSEDMIHVLHLYALMAAGAVQDEAVRFRGSTAQVLDHFEHTRALLDPHWSEAIVDVSTGGCFAPLSRTYVKKAWEVCSGRRSVSRHPPVTAYDLLLRMCSDQHALHVDHPTAVILSGIDSSSSSTTGGPSKPPKPSKPPTPVNRNYEAWKKAFEAHPVSSDSVKLTEMLTGQHSDPQWEPDMPYVRHLLKGDT